MKGLYELSKRKAIEIFFKLAEYKFSYRSQIQQNLFGYSPLSDTARELTGSLHEIIKGENKNNSQMVLNGKSRLIKGLLNFERLPHGSLIKS